MSEMRIYKLLRQQFYKYVGPKRFAQIRRFIYSLLINLKISHSKDNLDKKFLKEVFMKKNGFFIECGAADGFNLSSCKFFEEFMGWKGINVEASPAKYAKLVENRPNSFANVNKGLLNEPGSFVFRDDNKTIEDKQIEKIMTKIQTELENQLGATLR